MYKYYYRKEKYEISLKEGVKKAGNIVFCGEGDFFSIKDMAIRPLKDNNYYEKIWKMKFAQYGLVQEKLIKMAMGDWSFDVYYVLKSLWEGMEKQYVHYTVSVEIFKLGISYDYIMVDDKDDWIKYIIALQLNANGNNFTSFIREKDMRAGFVIKGQAACVLSHELFGHMLEIDNFYYYNYERYLPLISKLGVSIGDLPRMENSPAFYLYDDCGIRSRNVLLSKNGHLTGNIIGGNINQMQVTHALRRNDYKKKCLPRMSNLIVAYTGKSNSIPDSYIEIVKMGKCYFNHEKGWIEFNIDLAFFRIGSEIFKIKNSLFFKISIEELLNNLIPLKDAHTFIRPLQCQKRKQVIDCGVSSNDWFFQGGFEEYNVF